MTTNRWVRIATKGFSFAGFASTEDARLVLYRGGAVEVAGVEERFVLPRVLSGVDAVGSVLMTPLPLRLEWGGALQSAENVGLSASATLTLAVRRDEAAIRAVALDGAAQEEIACNLALATLQDECSRLRAQERLDTAAVRTAVLLSLRAIPQDATCFLISDFVLHSLAPSDISIRDVGMAAERARSRARVDAAEAVTDHARFEREAALQEAAHQLQRTRDAEAFTTELEREDARAESRRKQNARAKADELAHRKAEAELELEAARARAELLRTPEGRLALETVAERMKRLELEGMRLAREERWLQTLLPLIRKGGLVEGQLQTLVAVLQRTANVNLSGLLDESPPLGVASLPGASTAAMGDAADPSAAPPSPGAGS